MLFLERLYSKLMMLTGSLYMSVVFLAEEFAVGLEIGCSSSALLLLVQSSTWFEKQVVEVKGGCPFPVVFFFFIHMLLTL